MTDNNDVTNYDIDPTDFEFEREPCSTRDSTNNYTDTLGQIKGTKLWVHYRSMQTGPNEVQRPILGLGRLSMDGVELDTDVIIEEIHNEAERHSGYDEELDAVIDLLCQNAEDIAEELIEQWQFGAEEVIGDSIYEGYAGVNSGRAWAAHVDESITFEAQEVLQGFLRKNGYEPSESREEHDVLTSALYAAVEKRRDHWLRPHLEYEVDLSFDAEPWELRALELEQNTSLPRETARVAALRESGLRNFEVAEKLDIHESTVTRQVDRFERVVGEAEWLVKNGPTLD